MILTLINKDYSLTKSKTCFFFLQMVNESLRYFPGPIIQDTPREDVTFLIFNFSASLTLWHFMQWHFTQHPYWSESSTGQNLPLVALYETSKINFVYFQDQWLTSQTNTKLFSIFFPHSHVFQETSQKVTHPSITLSQAHLIMKFLSHGLLKSICILFI